MTTNQKRLYFREWGAARKRLREAGFSPAEADAERTKIHAENGLPESSKDFNNGSHLDKFLKACRAITGKPSADVDDQERKRLVYLIEQTGLDDPYLDHLARAKSEGFDWRTLAPDKLKHLLFTAKSRARAKSCKK
jgi:hypothetical protein